MNELNSFLPYFAGSLLILAITFYLIPWLYISGIIRDSSRTTTEDDLRFLSIMRQGGLLIALFVLTLGATIAFFGPANTLAEKGVDVKAPEIVVPTSERGVEDRVKPPVRTDAERKRTFDDAVDYRARLKDNKSAED